MRVFRVVKGFVRNCLRIDFRGKMEWLEGWEGVR